MKRLRIFVYGAGKVGTALAKALRGCGHDVTLRAQRKGLPARPIDASFVILAVRDREVVPTAEQLSRRTLLGRAVVVHCAGSLGPEALAAVRSPRVAVAQMHPMISFASKTKAPSLLRGQLHVDGDARAVALVRSIGRALGMSPRTIPRLNRPLYHAAAGLVANGAAALAAGGIQLLGHAGVDAKTAARMLGPLLRSVADNVESLGLPGALTGPVRRGDAVGVERHLAMLLATAPGLVPFYVASTTAQLPLARALGEAPAASFDAIAAVVAAVPPRC